VGDQSDSSSSLKVLASSLPPVNRRDLFRFLAGGAVGVALAGPLGAHVATGVVAQEGEKVFRVPSFEPDSLDPISGGAGYQEYQNLFEPLVDAYAKSGEIEPLAAESWTVSDDGLTITFTLRDGLKWSDGQPVVAEDYRYAWLRQLDPASASYAPDEFYPIKNGKEFNSGSITDSAEVGVKATDEKTLVVTLAAPAIYFLRSIGSTAFVPIRKDIIDKFGAQWIEAGNFVGNGPYMLDSWEHDQQMTFVKNPNYGGPWAETRLVDRIKYTVMEDPWNTAVPLFEAGDVDATIVPASELDRLKGDTELSQQLHFLPISGCVIMVFDTANAPTDDVRVRQALSIAIDREVLASQVLKGAYAPALSFSPPDLSSYDPSSALSTDPATAKQLLADAGFPDGAGFPAFTLTYWSQDRESLIAQTLKAMWKQTLNIDIDLQTFEPKAMTEWRTARADQPFNAYFALQWCNISDPQQFHNTQLDPEGNGRFSRYDNAEYVELIRTALVNPDPATRDTMYKQAEAIINKDVPITSIINEARTWLVRPTVANFETVTTAVAEMTRVSQPPGLDVTG
jgi:oligopeptide transport system substrate-binding protein